MARRSVVEILIQAKDATAGAFRAVGNGLTRFRDRLFSLRTAMQAFAAFVATKIVGQIVGAFAKQEQAIIKLNAALRVTGRFTDEGSKKIQNMATEMQKLTTVADEAALAVSGTIAQLATQLTTDQLAEVQKAAIGLAQTFGLDLEQAAVLVGKALAGERDVLSRYGISLDTTASQQNRFNELMRKTAPLFEVAVEATKSLTGQFAQAKNAVGELEESVGQLIVFWFGLDTAGSTLRDRITAVNEGLRENMGTWVKWGRVAILTIKALVQSVMTLVRFFFSAGKLIGHAFEIGIAVVAGAIIAFIDKVIIGGLNDQLLRPLTAILKQVGVDVDLTLGEIGAAEFFQDATEHITLANITVQEFTDSLRALGGAWGDVVGAIGAHPLPAAAFDTSGRGGGPNTGTSGPTPEQRAHDLASEANRLVAQLDAGIITEEKFRAELEALAVAMRQLQLSGQVTGDTLLELSAAYEKLREKAVSLQAIMDGPLAPPTFGQALINQIREATDAFTTMQVKMAEIVANELVMFGQAMGEAFAAVASGSQKAGQAFAEAMLASISQVAKALGQMYLAKAISEVAEAFANPVKAAKHLAAAAHFVKAAIAMYAVAGAAGAAAGRAGGGGGGGGASAAADRASAVARDREPATVVLQGDLWNLADPAFLDHLARALSGMEGRRVNVRREG